MSVPRVVAVAPNSPAARAGLTEGDEILSINGTVPRDLIEWRLLVDEPALALELGRGGLDTVVEIDKRPGEPLGVEVHSALFDRVQTCDNHCEFCFIYQLPPGLRRSLYLKDDDYRLSFLYGNFTTLTRFTEADLERVVSEGLGPLYVSIHATDPDVRAGLLRNRRGATSLRWLRALLDHGVEVHGQVVVCPGVNDGAVLDDTLAGVLDRYPELATLCVVPLGVSQFNRERRMRPHTRAEAEAVVECVADWQDVFRAVLGHRLVFAADEYYLLAERPFPPAGHYDDFPMHEDGVGMARAFEAELLGGDPAARPDTGPRPAHPAPGGPPCVGGASGTGGASGAEGAAGTGGASGAEGAAGTGRVADSGGATGDRGGFFRSADAAEAARAGRPVAQPAPEDGAPGACSGAGSTLGLDRSASSGAEYEPYRGERATPGQLLRIGPSRAAPVAVLTAPYGARVIAPLLERLGRPDVRVVTVDNRYFGGNISVSGLMVGSDLARVLADQPEGHRYLLPDVCLTRGRFLDGGEPADLPRPVEIVPADGRSLAAALAPARTLAPVSAATAAGTGS